MTAQRGPAEADLDARFLLANERTLLAWTRTALTLMAGGVGLALADVGRVLAPLLVLVGVLAQAGGAVRYVRADRALRRQDLPAVGAAPFLLAGAVAVLGTAVAVALALGEAR